MQFNSLRIAQRLTTRSSVMPLLAVVFLVAPSFIHVGAYAESFSEDSGFWTTTSASLKPSEQWRAGILVQTRSRDDFANLERTVLRPSVSYNLFGKTWLTAGYDAHFIELPTDRLEHRAWQQWLTIWPMEFASVSARTRIEERFIEDVDGTAARLRFQARVDVPIKGTNWKVTASNEYFFGLNDLDDGPNDGFDQNRAYVGVSTPLTDSLSLKLGYQMQYVNRENAEDAMIHQLLVGVALQ